jgi:N-formylglutamate deformylase
MNSESQVSRGDAPILVVAAHTGRFVPKDLLTNPTWEVIDGSQSDPGGALLADVARRYGASCISAEIHPCVIDMNVGKEDNTLTRRLNRLGLCRTHTAHGKALYPRGYEPTDEVINRRVQEFWTPFHESVKNEVLRLRDRHDNVLVLVVHVGSWLSPFRSQLATADCNFSTNNGASADKRTVTALAQAARDCERSWVINGRSMDGFATSHYGMPGLGINVVALEISGRLRREIELAHNRETNVSAQEAAMMSLLRKGECALADIEPSGIRRISHGS